MEPYYGDSSHPQCSATEGHTCARPSGRRCVEAGCDETAGTRWGPMWCPDHDAQRLDRVCTQLRGLTGAVDA